MNIFKYLKRIIIWFWIILKSFLLSNKYNIKEKAVNWLLVISLSVLFINMFIVELALRDKANPSQFDLALAEFLMLLSSTALIIILLSCMAKGVFKMQRLKGKYDAKK